MLSLFSAHEATVSSLSFSRIVPGLLATASEDKLIRVWDVSNIQSAPPTAAENIQQSHSLKLKSKKNSAPATASLIQPQCVAYKSMNVGKLFSVQYHMNDPFLLACAGDKGT
jgi:WD40 repeat protein